MQGENPFCPLCGTPLDEYAGDAPRCPQNIYPNISILPHQYNFIMRLLFALTLVGCAMSVLVNFLAMPGFMWSLIVVACAIYAWITIPPLLRKGVNFATRVVAQVVFTSLLVVVLDMIIGYRGWSVSYVIPSLLCAGTLAIGLMAVFNRTNWAEYVLAQVLIAIFGFVPLILYFLNISQNLIMVLVTTGISFTSLVAIIALGDRTVKSEFKRRFHI